MRVEGRCRLIAHPCDTELRVVAEEFTVYKGQESFTVLPGKVVNGASIPRIFCFLLRLDRYDKSYILAATVHDLLCGERGDPECVIRADGYERTLSWKEAAVWMRELMRLDLDGDGEKDNSKLTRRVFYQMVMIRLRLGILNER